jgi:hypothetical protein
MDSNSEEAIRILLRGQHLLVVGGDRRGEALRRLEVDLALSSVRHCVTRKEDASPRAFAKSLYDPKLLLVVWVLGLSRTDHGRHLHRICRSLGLPWIDCRRIPNPRVLVARLSGLRIGEALRNRRGRIATSKSAGPAPGGGT